jgi:hypothetical protein
VILLFSISRKVFHFCMWNLVCVNKGDRPLFPETKLRSKIKNRTASDTSSCNFKLVSVHNPRWRVGALHEPRHIATLNYRYTVYPKSLGSETGCQNASHICRMASPTGLIGTSATFIYFCQDRVYLILGGKVVAGLK